MKSLLCASVIIASATSTFAFGFGNGRCKNAGISNSTYITVIDTLKAWNGQPIVQLCEIRDHEYIIVRAGTCDGGVHIIHAESCPCKTK